MDRSTKNVNRSRGFVSEGFFDLFRAAIVILCQLTNRVAGLPALVDDRSGDARACDHRPSELDPRIDHHQPRRADDPFPCERIEPPCARYILFNALGNLLDDAAKTQLTWMLRHVDEVAGGVVDEDL